MIGQCERRRKDSEIATGVATAISRKHLLREEIGTNPQVLKPDWSTIRVGSRDSLIDRRSGSTIQSYLQTCVETRRSKLLARDLLRKVSKGCFGVTVF